MNAIASKTLTDYAQQAARYYRRFPRERMTIKLQPYDCNFPQASVPVLSEMIATMINDQSPDAGLSSESICLRQTPGFCAIEVEYR